MKKKTKITEEELKNTIKAILNELDWKTYQNAAKKSSFKGDFERADKFAKAASSAFNRDYFNKKRNWKDHKLERSVDGYMDNDNAFNPQIHGWLSTSLNGDEPVLSNTRHYKAFDGIDEINNEEYNFACDLIDKGISPDDAFKAAEKRTKSKYPYLKYDKEGRIKSNYRVKPKSGFNMNNLVDNYLSDTYDELDSYANKDYEYVKGKGWIKKEDNLSESRLKRIIKESLKKVLNEIEEPTGDKLKAMLYYFNMRYGEYNQLSQKAKEKMWKEYDNDMKQMIEDDWVDFNEPHRESTYVDGYGLLPGTHGEY